MLPAYLVFNWGRCLLWTTRGLSGPTKQLQSLCSKCACPTQNWAEWVTMWDRVPKTDSFVFFCCGWAYKREILRNQFLQTDFTLLNGERNQFYSSTKGKLFRVVSWRKCMVGMFGGVKLGGGGKLVMGEVCRIRIRKL